MLSTPPTRVSIRGTYRQTALLLVLGVCCIGWLLLTPRSAAASPALPVEDVAGGPHLYEVFNDLSGMALGSSKELDAWAGPDGSGMWDGTTWHGGMDSVAIAISSSAGNANHFGIYRDVATGNGKLTLHGGISGDALLGPIFDAEFLFEGASAPQPVGFWLSTQGLGGINTFHGRSELDRASTYSHLSSFHLPGMVSIQTDAGPLQVRNAHLIGWEDWNDADYDDLVVLVGEVGAAHTVPEPGTGLLWVVGLLVAAKLRRS